VSKVVRKVNRAVCNWLKQFSAELCERRRLSAQSGDTGRAQRHRIGVTKPIHLDADYLTPLRGHPRGVCASIALP